MSVALARMVSLIGHPLAMLPSALVLATALRTDDAAAPLRIALGVAAFAALVMALSWRQVRRGRWAHVDASAPRERRDLNLGLLAMLALAAVLAQTVAHDARVALALALAAGILVFALLTARLWKLSLHVAFATFAALLLWPLQPLASVAALAFAAAIAWSRLRLARHAPRDLVAGALAGLCAGLAHGALSGALRP